MLGMVIHHAQVLLIAPASNLQSDDFVAENQLDWFIFYDDAAGLQVHSYSPER